ncbi:MAG: radical SAM/SPASM domain-containing protein [Methylococcales bacterium]|nr:radical SAM/SPASM domain-containing protein [Methylococcales bacterium]MBT7444186.1 radical SAM/SPASM domain-containing protein [Methylococcales bacterium]
MIDLTYRGSLSSCNYDCQYCPFAKTRDDSARRLQDQKALTQFVDWVESRQSQAQFRVLFTPWGEALIRKWYREAMLRLAQMPHVQKVVMQTNLSSSLQWLKWAEKIALWTTFHPTETTIAHFIQQTQQLDLMGVAYSVGIVGTKENQSTAKALRAKLNPKTYLWVNAYKEIKGYYQAGDVQNFQRIDPLFDINLSDYSSKGKPCRSAVSAISIDGGGNVTPCHFVGAKLGNIYQQSLGDILQHQYACPNDICDCYIGYIHLPSLALENTYGDALLERIPKNSQICTPSVAE